MARANDAVAQMLDEFADLLAISGGEPFKVRVYEKAARAVAGYAGDVSSLDEAGLQDIPGVGSHLARKIGEFRANGSVEELEELRARVPAGLRTLLGIPGLGPKRARQVYEELGITSLPGLLDALHGQRLRHLKGWGDRSEANLARALEEAHAAGGRVRLDVALDLAEELVDGLRSSPEVARVAYAGSLRRMKETIGDIDLLVAATRAQPVMEAFVSLPLVGRVTARGGTRASVVTTKGIQVDLRVVDPEVWGAALLYFTGSKAHSIHVRDLAVRAGLKLSEYGLFEADTGTLVVAGTEEGIYAALGMEWVPPVLREDTGEVQAALEGSLPPLVRLSDIKGDLHTHTNLTDGVAPMEEMVAAARLRGYRYYAVTDHAPGLYMQRMTLEKMLEQRRALRRLEKGSGLTLLHGTEADIAPDGSIDWDPEVLAGFDVVVASVHSAFRQSSRAMTARLVRAMQNPYVNVIGHPTGRSLGRRAPVEVDLDEVFRVAAATGTALEINSFPDRLDLDDTLVRRARRAGVRFVVSTDAHAVPHLDYMRFGVAMAQRGWAGPSEVVNAWPLARMRRFLAKPAARPARAG